MATSTLPPPAAPTPAVPAPAPVTAAPVTPAAGQTSDSLLDKAFADTAAANPISSPEAVPGTTDPVPATEVTPDQTQQPGEVPAAAPAEALPDPTDLDFSEGIEPDSVSEDGKRHFFKPAKSLRLQQAGKFVQALQDILPNATVEDIKNAVETSHAAEFLMQRYRQGESDPAAIDDVIDTFKSNENPRAFGMMAVRMLTQLPQVEPFAAQFIERQYQQQLVGRLKQAAQQSVDPAARENAIALIQNLQIALSGNPKGFESRDAILAAANADPLAQQRAELDRQRTEIEQFRQQQQQAATTSVVNRIEDSQKNGLYSEIDSLLTPVKSAYENTPDWKHIRQDFVDAIVAAENNHPEWRVKLDNLRNEVMLNPSEQNFNNFTNYWRSIVRAVARPNSKAILERWANRQVQRNQAATAAATNRGANEPSLNGVAAAPGNGVKVDAAVKAKGWDAVYKAINW